MISMPPIAPKHGLNALVATVTTPPPSGLRQETSTYFGARRTKPIVVRATNSGARWPTSLVEDARHVVDARADVAEHDRPGEDPGELLGVNRRTGRGRDGDGRRGLGDLIHCDEIASAPGWLAGSVWRCLYGGSRFCQYDYK